MSKKSAPDSTSSLQHEVQAGTTGVVIPLEDGLRVKIVPISADSAKITLVDQTGKRVDIPETFQIFNESIGSALVQHGEDNSYEIALGATYSIFYHRKLVETIAPTAMSKVTSFSDKQS